MGPLTVGKLEVSGTRCKLLHKKSITEEEDILIALCA